MTDTIHPDILYHYCNIETFYNIIKNKTLRLSDISQSNDLMELNWTPFIATPWLESIYIDTLALNQYDESIVSSVFEYTKSYFTMKQVRPLVCCFSMIGDLLSQWRGYAFDGTGVAIGFNPNKLLSLPPVRWEAVEYNTDNQHSYIQPILEAIFSPEILTEKDSSLREKNVLDLIVLILDKTSTFKNPAFVEEREYRLVYKPGVLTVNKVDGSGVVIDEFFRKMSNKSTNGNCILNPIDYYIKNDKLIPYIDLSFEPIKDSFINEICLGPKCKLTRYDVQAFLYSNGVSSTTDGKISAIIRESLCTYR